MKHIYIHCQYTSAEQYQKVLEKLCPATVRDITVTIHFPQDVSARQIEGVVEAQKAFSQTRKVRFRNYAFFAQMPRLSRQLRKALRKNAFALEFQVQQSQVAALVRLARCLEKDNLAYKFTLWESADQQADYQLFASHGLPLCFAQPQYTAESPAQFDRWLTDPAAQGVNTFCDIINMLVMQSHSPNCRHASCFGTTFYVDAQQNVYLCPFHADARTCLGSLNEAENLEKLLNCQAVAQLLPAVVQKRQGCADGCQAFAWCQGGCMLETETGSECTHYGATVEHICRRLLEVYRGNDLSKVNSVVKNAILNALAFGTAFFNLQ